MKSRSFKKHKIPGDKKESMQISPKGLYLVEWQRRGILGKQECSEWTENSIFTKISNLWQQDIYGNMSCRDTLA